MTIFPTLFPLTLRTRRRNRTIVGIVLSILIHVLLFFALRSGLDKMPPPSQQEHAPLQVTFIPNSAAPPVSKAIHPKQQPVRKPTPVPHHQAPVARVPSPAPARPSTLPPSPTAITQAAPEMDMSTMINAARERRRAAEADAAAENQAARDAERGEGPSANDIARANIAFQERRASGGTNGVFEITSKGPRVAQYVFRGWTTDSRRSRSQTITVDAGLNGDVEKAIVDSMIALIRQYYKGDFNWDSHRLGRVVPLSARPEDTRGLESFLMLEFF